MTKNDVKRRVHIMLQGKGGVGKSFVAAIIAQHLMSKPDAQVVCIDTDPVNATLMGYGRFATRRAEILDGSTIDTRRFDQMMDWVLAEDADFVIDNGASCFIPFTNYLFEVDGLGTIRDAGKDVLIHTVITGGQALVETLHGLSELVRQAPGGDGRRIVCWLNEYFGPIELDGKTFEQMQVYERARESIAAVFRLPAQNPQTFGVDLRVMLERKLTFDEAIAGPGFYLMSKQRLKMMQRLFCNQLSVLEASKSGA
jgi:hypothetical protein